MHTLSIEHAHPIQQVSLNSANNTIPAVLDFPPNVCPAAVNLPPGSVFPRSSFSYLSLYFHYPENIPLFAFSS